MDLEKSKSNSGLPMYLLIKVFCFPTGPTLDIKSWQTVRPPALSSYIAFFCFAEAQVSQANDLELNCLQMAQHQTP